MTRIRRMNLFFRAIGIIALLVGVSMFNLSFTGFLLLVVALSIAEVFAVHLYRKHRLLKPNRTKEKACDR